MTIDTETMARTDEEILAHINQVQLGGDDFLGATREDLVMALGWPAVESFLTPEAQGLGEEGWAKIRQTNPGHEARTYMPFAIGKALNHRGLSANRSVDHFRAWVWLMGDEAYDSIDWDDYGQYGVPILKAVAELVGAPWPTEPELERMAAGLPCDPEGCYSGCGF